MLTILSILRPLVGTTTGISAHDRALTARKLADPKATSSDFTRPGHMVPLRYTEGGVLSRRGHTEAATGTSHPLFSSTLNIVGSLVVDFGYSPPVLVLVLVHTRSMQTDWTPRRRPVVRDRQAGRPYGIHGSTGRLQGVCPTMGVQDDQYRSAATVHGEEAGGAVGVRFNRDRLWTTTHA